MLGAEGIARVDCGEVMAGYRRVQDRGWGACSRHWRPWSPTVIRTTVPVRETGRKGKDWPHPALQGGGPQQVLLSRGLEG